MSNRLKNERKIKNIFTDLCTHNMYKMSMRITRILATPQYYDDT